MKKTIISMLIVTLSVISCTRDSSLTPEVSSVHTEDQTSAIPITGARVSVNGSAVEYRVGSSYESNYVHTCQLGATNGSNACGPDAYMLAAHMIAGANGWSFMPSNITKLNRIISKIGSLPIGMTQISNFVAAYDNTHLQTSSIVTTNRNSFKSFLEDNLVYGDPVIVPIRISGGSRTNDSRYTTENSSTNYDIDGTDQSGRPNYVNTTGVGHFVVVIGIKVFGTTGDGYVYYKDPLASSGTTKVCVYSRFLNSALANGASNTYYDAIAIREKWICNDAILFANTKSRRDNTSPLGF